MGALSTHSTRTSPNHPHRRIFSIHPTSPKSTRRRDAVHKSVFTLHPPHPSCSDPTYPASGPILTNSPEMHTLALHTYYSYGLQSPPITTRRRWQSCILHA